MAGAARDLGVGNFAQHRQFVGMPRANVIVWIANLVASSVELHCRDAAANATGDVFIGSGSEQRNFFRLPGVMVWGARVDRADVELAPALLDTGEFASEQL